MDQYVTDDGLEIPAPRRELGPRRLSRYHQEVAELMRALRDGSQLPEGLIEDLGDFPLGEPGSEERLIHDRFQQALASGAFVSAETSNESAESEATPASMPKSPWADNKATDTKASGTEENDSEPQLDTAESSSDRHSSSPETNSVTEVSETATDEGKTETKTESVAIEQQEITEKSTALQQEDSPEITHPLSRADTTAQKDDARAQKIEAVSSSIKASEKKSGVEEETISQVSNGLHAVKAELPSLSSFARVQDKLEEIKVSKEAPALPELPKPVGALTAQGLDLDALNRAEERAARKQAAEDEAKHQQEQLRKAKAEEAVRQQAIAAIEAENKAQEEAAVARAAAAKKKKGGQLISLLLLLVVGALLVVWLLFFQ